MKITPTKFKGVLIIEPEIFEDNRGYFKETFNKEIFKINKLPYNFVQDNQSISLAGVIRGIHYQKGKDAQGKLISVTCGSVKDVIVDLNPKSKTFGEHISIFLSADNNTFIYIPPGYGHGFLALEDHTIFNYKVTKKYNPDSEGGIIWNDSDLNIDWELDELKHTCTIISKKDSKLSTFKEYANK
jgi:dTDP-4-dehydrorhamnose 3,5-epimerase